MNSRKINKKDSKEIFLKEKEECKGPFYHIMGDIKDPALIEIDNLYSVADSLSIKNAKKHHDILLTLSILGPFISVIFFLYFEGEMHYMILLCVILLFLLYIIHRKGTKMECHRKYLEYRVLAESLRLQFFLSLAGIKVKVADIMPWFLKKGIPWIEEMLEELPLNDVKEKSPIIYYWIVDQKTYHEEALKRAESRKKKDEKIAKTVLYVTIFGYILALLFEAYMYICSPNIDAHLIRIGLKIVIGSMSVGALFLESYYGKMSLSETINDHKRMISLYKKIEDEIVVKGEKEEIILYLAKEYLIENSTWYAYQSKNKAELVL